MDLCSFVKDSAKKIMEHREKKRDNKNEKLLKDSLGAQNLPYMTYNIEEKKAIAFCKEYHHERKWCHKHQLDLNLVKEEEEFWKFMKKFEFMHKR